MPNIAHIGAGYWGKNIIRNLNALKVLTMVCDTNEAALAAVQKDYPDLQLTTMVDEILSNTEIDAVTIATPAATHFALAKQALEAGKDVFVEKPLALKPEDGEKLAELAEKHKRVLMVGHILRYHPAIEKIKQLVDSGDLGRVGYCYSNRLNLGRVRREENILWSFAPHDISVMNYLMGGPPDEVNASGEIILQPGIHDITLTVLKWRSGVMAHINVSWLHPFKEHRFVVIGDKAMLVFDDTKNSEKLLLYKKGIDFVKGEPIKRDGDVDVIEYDNSEPLRNEMMHFIDCVEKRSRPHTDAQEGLAVLRVLHRAQATIEKSADNSEQKPDSSDYFAHSTAIVDEGAAIGTGTKIWHFSHVMGRSEIGERCSLGQNVFVAANVKVGNNVKIQNNVSIYEGVVLEDDVFCGPSMVFTNVKNPRSAVPRNTADDYLTTHVRKGATLGANCTVVCGTTIGENAFVAAGAVVTRDIIPNALMAGVPAKQIGWMCHCGFRLKSDKQDFVCRECRRRYRVVDGMLQASA